MSPHHCSVTCGYSILFYPIILQARAAGTAVEGQSREEETEEDHQRV